ncbi:hypothetical protein, partial [Bradyrhizobium sp. NBAIM08]|uniref:hypothetical protein n=1 Tax=Bradyrhizobium sp. NBAIM08 TaxID=2793815 RepID=UPI001CD2ED90
TFLREGEALHQFGEGTEAGGTPDDGLRHTPGFQYDAATAAAMRHLDLSRVPAATPLADRVLLLSREDRPAPLAIAERLAAEPSLESLPAWDQDRLLDLAPSDNFVPQRALGEVVAWLARGLESAPPVPVAAPT